MSENDMQHNPEMPVTDADLIRYVDGEPDAATRASIDALIAERSDVAARVDQLRQRSMRLTRLLAHVDPHDSIVSDSAASMRPRIVHGRLQRWWWQRAPRGMKTAAAIALLFGFVLAVPDARAWVAARVRAVAAGIGIVSTVQPAEPPVLESAAPTTGPAVEIGFPVRGDTIDIEADVSNGVLIVRRAARADATAETTSPAIHFTVLPGGLRIEGSAPTAWEVMITAPERTRVVRVRDAAGRVISHAWGGGEFRTSL